MADNIFIVGDFDEGMETFLLTLTEEIKNQTKFRDGRIDLYITSGGGNYFLLQHAVELLEAAKREGVVIRTMVPAAAYSAGSMLAVAGTPGERYIGRNADHLVHYGSIGGLEETTPLQTSRVGRWKNEGWKRVVKHYEKYCNIPDLETHLSDDMGFIPATTCIKWGLADKYMDKLTL